MKMQDLIEYNKGLENGTIKLKPNKHHHTFCRLTKEEIERMVDEIATDNPQFKPIINTLHGSITKHHVLCSGEYVWKTKDDTNGYEALTHRYMWLAQEFLDSITKWKRKYAVVMETERIIGQPVWFDNLTDAKEYAKRKAEEHINNGRNYDKEHKAYYLQEPNETIYNNGITPRSKYGAQGGYADYNVCEYMYYTRPNLGKHSSMVVKEAVWETRDRKQKNQSN